MQGAHNRATPPATGLTRARPPDAGSTRAPTATAAAERPRPLDDTVQLKLRFSEALRRRLEHEASRHGRSMNAEIIKRLETSFMASEQIPRLVADALLKGLDPDIIDAMGDTLIEQWKSEQYFDEDYSREEK
jgi:plasmid stability protein